LKRYLSISIDFDIKKIPLAFVWQGGLADHSVLFDKYKIAFSSISLLSQKRPRPQLHLEHNKPLKFPFL